MKKTIVLGVVAFLMTAGLVFASSAQKVTIDHKGTLISDSCHALPAHRAHGDKFSVKDCSKKAEKKAKRKVKAKK